MSYVVIDGKKENEFGTLEEAIKFRDELPLPIYQKEDGKLEKIPFEQITSAVQQKDYGKREIKSNHFNLTLVMIFAFMLVVLLLTFLWNILKEAA